MIQNENRRNENAGGSGYDPIFGKRGKAYYKKLIEDWIWSLAEKGEIIEQAIHDANGSEQIAAELIAKRHGITELLNQLPSKEARAGAYLEIMAVLQEIVRKWGTDEDPADWWKESRALGAAVVSMLLESDD